MLSSLASRLRTFKARDLRALSWPVLTLLVAGIIVWRTFDFIVNPDLRAEDGAKVFAYFYVHRALGALFRFKAGYLPLLPNVIGWLAVRLPPRATPYFLTLVPTSLTIVALTVLAAPAYRKFVPSDLLRCAICLSLALAPFGAFLMTCNTDYSIWNALLLLLFLALLPMPEHKWGAALFLLAQCLLIWSHPLSLVVLPATLVWLWRDKRTYQRVLYGLLVLSQGLHLWLGTDTHRAAAAKGDGSLSHISELVMGTLKHVCRQVLAPSLFPWGTGSAVSDYGFAGALAVCLLLCALLPKHPVASRAFCAWVAYAVVAPMALIVLARAEHGLNSQRYHYVSKAFGSVALCVVLAQALSTVSRLSRKRDRLAFVPAAGTVAYFAYLGVSTGHILRYEQPTPENGRLVAKFFSELAEAEQKQGSYCNIRLSCKKRRGDWPFTIDTRRVCDE